MDADVDVDVDVDVDAEADTDGGVGGCGRRDFALDDDLKKCLLSVQLWGFSFLR